MSLFDKIFGKTEEEPQFTPQEKLFDQGYYGGDTQIDTGGDGMMVNLPYANSEMPLPVKPVEPQKPDYSKYMKEGMAAQGVATAPTLPDPTSTLKGLMSMMGDPNIERNESPLPQQQMGSLMQYLSQLGRG